MNDYERIQHLEQQVWKCNDELARLHSTKSEILAQENSNKTYLRLLGILIGLRTPRLGMTHDLWGVAIVLLFPTFATALAFVVTSAHAWITVLVFVASGSFFTIALIAPSTPWITSTVQKLTLDISAAEFLVEDLLTQIGNRTRAVIDLQLQQDAIVNSIEYRRMLIERRAQELLSQSWEAMQGIAFEDFLFCIFENLGASVSLTPISGDQGADLIATIAGRKYAIQAKGGVSTIGNDAVMAAIAGMHYYSCDAPVVITNSTFTRKAVELAERSNCLLIDGASLADLALGKFGAFQPQIG